MNFPTRPQNPNPYQIIGQAAQQVGSDVRTYGKEQDELAERFNLMMQKRAAAELEKKQREEEFSLKKNADDRAAADAKAKADKEATKSKFLQDFTGADPADPATQLKLKNALMNDVIDPATYKALQPKERNLQTVPGRGLYEIPETGAPVQLVDAPPPKPESQLPEQRLDLQAHGQTFQQENALRDEFNKKTLPFETGLTAFTKMQNAIKQNNSADAYAAVIDFVKTLDPGSTVREGEYITAKAAGAGGQYGKLKQAIRNLYDGKMTPEVQKALYESGLSLIKAEKSSYDRVRDDYKRRVDSYNGRGYNLDPNAVLSDYGNLENTLKGYDSLQGKDSKANDKTFNSFQEAASLPVGTGFWINGKHYTKGAH